MPGIARQFEPHITRSGGIPSKYCFTVRCSACSTTETYEAGRSVSDADVRRYFDGRGWILGRRRSDDLCSACLGTSGHTRPPRLRDEPHRREAILPAKEADRTPAPADKRHRETADILARHLGKPEALAAEVFRPRGTQSPRSIVSDAVAQPVPSPALPCEIEQTLIGIASDLKGLRSTMEQVAEQIRQLVALGGQQIEAVARLAPFMVQSTDRISGGLQDVVSAVRAMPGSAVSGIEPAAPDGEADTAYNQEAEAEPEPLEAPGAVQPSRRVRRPSEDRSMARRKAPDAISVKSIPDAKRPDRFYTSVRLPREMWDGAGFTEGDRIQLDWTKKTLSITRVPDGGVKPKAIGETVVVLQSWRLGALNFDRAKIASGDGSLRLTMRP